MTLSINKSTTKSSSSSFFLLRPVYYYTRCVSQYPYPVPYGEYLRSYQKAYRIPFPIIVPHILIEYGVVRWLHIITVFLQMLHKYLQTATNTAIPILFRPFLHYLVQLVLPPYLESIDYLLQVTLNEHTFDVKETIQDFPNLLHVEETMEECFRRRRRRRQL
jgi:hypothetical protein